MMRETSPGSNYYVPIYSSKNASKVAMFIWFLDSHDTNCDHVNISRGCVERVQIKWFEETYDRLEKQHGSGLAHIMFIHIPIPEFVELY